MEGCQQTVDADRGDALAQAAEVVSPNWRPKGKQVDKSLRTSAALVLLLTACASGRMGQEGDKPNFIAAGQETYRPVSRWWPQGYNPFIVFFTAPTPNFPNVFVRDDMYIVVDQEPIYIKQNDYNAIFWALDPTSPYYFPDTNRDQGIEFDSPKPTSLKCGAQSDTDGKTFYCTYKRSNKAKYRYTIKVTKDGTQILKSDPTIMND